MSSEPPPEKKQKVSLPGDAAVNVNVNLSGDDSITRTNEIDSQKVIPAPTVTTMPISTPGSASIPTSQLVVPLISPACSVPVNSNSHNNATSQSQAPTTTTTSTTTTSTTTTPLSTGTAPTQIQEPSSKILPPAPQPIKQASKPAPAQTNKFKPFKIGEDLQGLSQGYWYNCVVVDAKKEERAHPLPLSLASPTQDILYHYSYYVHFLEFNRRLDRWLPQDHLRALPKEEVERRETLAANALPKGVIAGVNNNSKRMTRGDKRKIDDLKLDDDHSNLAPEDLVLEKAHEERTKVKNIDMIQIGKYEVDTWYFSPYPMEYRNCSKIYICEFCLRYMKFEKTLNHHKKTCKIRHPPGNEIYRDKNISVFEVDGAKQKIYCQCLCLLSKLFIDHKTLYYDVEPFLFYILCEHDKDGYHVVGYFSKEKQSADNYNVACILTFPQSQRKGYGKFLIQFSYELSKIEGKVGSPEKPLSDLGKVSYRSYWTRVLLLHLDAFGVNKSISMLSKETCITEHDIISTLQQLSLVRYCKGEHVLNVEPRILSKHLQHLQQQSSAKRTRLSVNASKIKWIPPSLWTKPKAPR